MLQLLELLRHCGRWRDTIYNTYYIRDIVAADGMPAVRVIGAIHAVEHTILGHPLFTAAVTALGHYTADQAWLLQINL